MGKKSFSREKAEEAEKMETISNDVPSGRVQQTQQVANTDDAISAQAPKSSFQAKKTKGKGSELKQEAISEVLTGSGSASGMGINGGGRSVSGTGGGILGASNSTPRADQSRSNSRVGKKLDRTATKLNYTPSEQVLLEVDESKPLADSADADQGYNGTYRNEFARSQKRTGAVPADLMFQRSVDLIAKDKLYFVEGQMLFQTGDDRTVYAPSSTIIYDEETGEYYDKDVEYTLGNFLHRGLHFGLNEDGSVRYFYADVVDLTPQGLSPEDVNVASAHKLIKMNTAELDRMSMDATAGDEKADKWTPLARAIKQPTEAASLMSSIDALTGAYLHLAYSKATTNLSYQLNRGAKDGLNEVTPAVENACGWRGSDGDSITLGNRMGNAVDRSYMFKYSSYRLGDPTLMIDAYDSINKYHNKADFLLQPRSYRMHLQTADNNMNPLRIPKEYANVYAATETFSTIDHEYDPLMPICMTDKANIISPFNLNTLCGFYKNSGYKHVFLDITYDTTNGADVDRDLLLVEANVPKRMEWDALYVSYKMHAVEGDYVQDAVLEYNSTTHKITIKAHSPAGLKKASYDVIVSNTVPQGYTALVSVANASDVDYNITFSLPKVEAGKITAINAFVAEHNTWLPLNGGEYSYSYSDLRNNYIVQVKHPLINGIIEYLNNSIGAKIKSLLQESGHTDYEDLYIPLIFSTQYMTLAQVFLCAATPWIVRVRKNSFKDVIDYEENFGNYPYSKLAPLSQVPIKNYVNFTYTDYDNPLETKIMNPVQAINWTMPEFFWKVDDEKYVLPWYFNENDLNTDGTVNDDASTMSMPSIRSGIRLGLLDNFYGMSEKDIRLSLDRMTKFLLRDNDIDSFGAYKYGRTTDGQIYAIMDSHTTFTLQKILSCPRELGLSMEAPLGVLTVDPSDGTGITTALKAMTADGTATSYRIKVWTNPTTPEHPDILSAFGVNITRAANYIQKWFELCADNANANTDVAGLVFGLGDDVGEFSPFAELGTGAQMASQPDVTSYQRALNTRLQFLPFIISPFDGNYSGSQTYDIYDFAYMFGLCGFRASDYRESVYNREKRVVNEGMLFVSDPWIEDSPIMNGAAKSTGLLLSKGYELK